MHAHRLSDLPAIQGTRDFVLVALRAAEAPAFLAMARRLLPEGALLCDARADCAAETRPALTLRQHEILQLLVLGLSNKEIARRLSLSHFTVRNHIAQVFRAFNLSTRHQAMQWYATVQQTQEHARSLAG